MKDRKVVVVADDEPVVREFMRVILSPFPCVIFEAENGEEALAVVRREGSRVALVMLDAMMPGLGGVEAITHVRREAPGAMVVLISGNPHLYRKKALASGAHAVLGKPFRIDLLMSLIRQALDHEGHEEITLSKAQ